MTDQPGQATATRPVQAIPPRQLALPWTALVTLAAGAWAITVIWARAMGNGPGTMGLAVLPFLGLWVLMMAAMMLPSVAPVAVLWTRLITGTTAGLGRAQRIGMFLSGYLLAWAACGAVAFAALTWTGRLFTAAPTAAKWLGVAIFITAGGYQLTPGRTGACAAAVRRSARSCTTPASKAAAAMPGSASTTASHVLGAAGA
jgi:hypothetical protein